MSNKAKAIMVATVIGIFGFTTLSFAGWGCGYGPMMGPGWQQGRGYYGTLSANEIEKMDQGRADFLKATEDVRQQLYETRLALENELVKKDPDTRKASQLQGEISKLQTELDQKRLDYEIQAGKSIPNYRRGFRGNGPMMSSGPRGGRCSMWLAKAP